ncbi:hypothetical protein CR513_34270, partial [Mucuna pruriens]
MLTKPIGGEVVGRDVVEKSLHESIIKIVPKELGNSLVEKVDGPIIHLSKEELSLCWVKELVYGRWKPNFEGVELKMLLVVRKITNLPCLKVPRLHVELYNDIFLRRVGMTIGFINSFSWEVYLDLC